jgi:hypothetical protein
MRINILFIRFYKSFNFDYLRKVHPDAKFDTWDMIDGAPYPFVRIALDAAVTTVVGANESGKSHLLTAIEKGLTGENIEREDFCRYSQFFTVEEGKTRWPEFGFEFVDLTEADKKSVVDACGVADPGFEKFLLFRTTRDRLTIYLPSRDKYSTHPVITGKEVALLKRVPKVVHLRADVALPDSVPILALLPTPQEKDSKEKSAGAAIPRHSRFEVLDRLAAVAGQSQLFESDDAVKNNAPAIRSSISSILQAARTVSHGKGYNDEAGIVLAKALLFKVARVDQSAISDLYDALREGNDGHANGLMQKINEHLAATLNFPHWWVQDRDFQLVVTPRDYDLVLTIRDRTGTDYSFSERSGGLKYFLSYYVQYRAHTPAVDRQEILLMDEPDAHLSSEGQQDLLKIFEAFANPDDGRNPVQLVYVTHSPFLIDKNHAERIRVLEKGVSEEGTRVVRDAARNHYEPLRSAFGAYVGETTFIGNCNLVVEGLADQVLLAGAATQLRQANSAELQTLDLNHLTVVPAGSASHVPYLVFLARGRDTEQPAVIVFLDSDTAGNDAVKALKRGGPRQKQLLRENLILQIGNLQNIVGSVDGATTTEDLIPLGISIPACKRYAKELCGVDDEELISLTADNVRKQFKKEFGVFNALVEVLTQIPASEPIHLDKVAFARYALAETALLREEQRRGSIDAGAHVQEFDKNFQTLFSKLNAMRRDAEREARGDRVSVRVDRAKKSFILDHPMTATKEQAVILLEEIEAVLDSSQESDAIRAEIQGIRRDFQLGIGLKDVIGDLTEFKLRLDRLKYAGRIATQDETTLPAPAKQVLNPGMDVPPTKGAQEAISGAPDAKPNVPQVASRQN